MSNKELTGKRRYRILRNKVVLQVQERWLDTDYVGGTITSDWYTGWRDATLEDLTEFEQPKKENK